MSMFHYQMLLTNFSNHVKCEYNITFVDVGRDNSLTRRDEVHHELGSRRNDEAARRDGKGEMRRAHLVS